MSTRHLRVEYFKSLKVGDLVLIKAKRTDNVIEAMEKGFNIVGSVVKKNSTMVSIKFQNYGKETTASFWEDMLCTEDFGSSPYNRKISLIRFYWLCLPWTKYSNKKVREYFYNSPAYKNSAYGERMQIKNLPVNQDAINSAKQYVKTLTKKERAEYCSGECVGEKDGFHAGFNDARFGKPFKCPDLGECESVGNRGYQDAFKLNYPKGYPGGLKQRDADIQNKERYGD